MFNGTVESLAAMIWSRTTLAESMRACKSSRDEAADAVEASRKHKQREAMVFFILWSFPMRSRPAGAVGSRKALVAACSLRGQVKPVGQLEDQRRPRLQPCLRMADQQMDRDSACADEATRQRAYRTGDNSSGDHTRAYGGAVLNSVALGARAGLDGALA